MACNGCAKQYSLLRKEKGCPSCGFSYCSKCLNNKIFVMKLNAEAKVCAKCKNSINASESKTVEPPDAYYRRLGILQDKQTTNKTAASNLNTEDDQILERLKKLKEDRSAQPTTTDDDIRQRLSNIKGEMPSTSDSDIQTRLANLRGVPVEVITAKPVLPPPDTRSEQEQIDDLLKQYMEKTTIDTKYQNELDGIFSDIEMRMQKLKGNDNKESVPVNIESEDEEETVKKIVEKVKAEVVLEGDDISPSTNDELPFCEICNEDAKMRCLGCNYLFCKRCYLDHKDDDDGCNRYEPYEYKGQKEI